MGAYRTRARAALLRDDENALVVDGGDERVGMLGERSASRDLASLRAHGGQ